jgi:hypothetical protein
VFRDPVKTAFPVQSEVRLRERRVAAFHKTAQEHIDVVLVELRECADGSFELGLFELHRRVMTTPWANIMQTFAHPNLTELHRTRSRFFTVQNGRPLSIRPADRGRHGAQNARAGRSWHTRVTRTCCWG